MIQSSQRMSCIQTPIIPTIADLIGANPGTISLGQGIVHYPPPPSVHGFISRFWDDPKNHQYGPVEGIDPLREALQDKLIRENDIGIAGRAVVVTAGSNMAFLNILLAITDPGDEVVLPEPFYFNQEMAVRIADCVPVTVATDRNGQLDHNALEAALTPKTRALVTVSPNNPTGVVYPEVALRAVNRLCRDRGIYHISDEAYEYFLYDGATHFSPGAITGSEDHTIGLYSLSKSYGFASWRIGYAVIPESLLGALRKVQDTNVICPTAIAQFAAVGALQTGHAYCAPYIEALASVRSQAIDAMESVAGKVQLLPSAGAFYFFVEVPDYVDGGLTLATDLIEQHGVAVIPGSAFGVTDRCSFRASFGGLHSADAIEGLGRLVTGLKALA
ncbi:MAG: aspartate aminotransferase [Acidiferrobacteraceae bacterium]|nr:aspartate aminotransferase [Acidiferrobacteraceae bacterium]